MIQKINAVKQEPTPAAVNRETVKVLFHVTQLMLLHTAAAKYH
jgi:hypothetical protein